MSAFCAAAKELDEVAKVIRTMTVFWRRSDLNGNATLLLKRFSCRSVINAGYGRNSAQRNDFLSRPDCVFASSGGEAIHTPAKSWDKLPRNMPRIGAQQKDHSADAGSTHPHGFAAWMRGSSPRMTRKHQRVRQDIVFLPVIGESRGITPQQAPYSSSS